MQLEFFIDSRFGIIENVEKCEGTILGETKLVMYKAKYSDPRFRGIGHKDCYGWGTSYISDHAAQVSAIAEGIERYSGILQMDSMPYAGKRRVGVGKLFLNTQFCDKSFPFIDPEDYVNLQYVRGKYLNSSKTVYVPLDRVSNYLSKAEKRICPLPYAGLAVGVNYEAAIEHAIFELIERDALTVSWLTNAPWDELISLKKNLRTADGLLKFSYYKIPSVTGAHVIACIAFNEATKLRTVGAAASRSALHAADKAASEASMLHIVYEKLSDPIIYEATFSAGAEGVPLLPWNVDPELNALWYRKNSFSKMTELICNLQFFLATSSQLEFIKALNVEGEVSIDTLEDDVRALCEIVSVDPNIAVIDMTPPELKNISLKSVRVVSDFLIPNTPQAFIPFGHPRLQGAIIKNIPIPYA